MEFNVADLIERVAQHVPDSEAIICGNTRATYRHLDETSAQFACYLLSAGLGKGEHIGIYAYNSVEWVIAMLACYKIGAVPININYRYVEEELYYICNDADLKAMVYDAEFTPRLNNICQRLPLLQQFIHFDKIDTAKTVDCAVVPGSTGFSSACQKGKDLTGKVTWPARSGDDHYVLYTGGTTGMPKGVVWRQEDVIMGLGGGVDMATHTPIASPELMADRCIKEGAFRMRSLQMAPLMHGAAQWGVLRALFEGATVIMSAKKSFDGNEVWQLVEKELANVVLITGDAMAKPMMDALEANTYNLSSMFVLASSAAVFSPALKDQYVDKLPNVMIMDNIGSSESGYTGATVHAKGKAEMNAGGPRVSPAKNTIVLDDNNEIMVPGDERTGFLAKGGFIPLAYYKDAKKTAETFIHLKDGSRYVIPGDMARHNADGTITLLGRGSLCINSGGEKIYPEEVEMAIKAHPDVFDCLVVGTPHERFGSCVTALIHLREGAAQPAMESIHEACKTHIAGYKVPRRIYYVAHIERSPSGKPDYKWAKAEAMRLYETP